MRIAVIGPLKDQFRHIERKCQPFTGTRHSLYWLDKDSAKSKLSSCAHYDVLVVCTEWVSHAVVRITQSSAHGGLIVRYVKTRGQNAVVNEIQSVIIKSYNE